MVFEKRVKKDGERLNKQVKKEKEFCLMGRSVGWIIRYQAAFKYERKTNRQRGMGSKAPGGPSWGTRPAPVG